MDENEGNNLKYYMNVVGGHSLIVKDVKRNVLLKSSSEKEIKFYEQMKNNKSELFGLFAPKYFGLIKKETECFNQIRDLIDEYNYFFRYTAKIHPEIDFNIEGDQEFSKKFEDFIQEIKDEDKFDSVRFKEIEEYLENICLKKLKWLVFSFVKWKHLFFKSDFIIIEEVGKDYKLPAFLDLKIGRQAKKGKERTSIHKLKNSTSLKFGFRLMGSQSFNLENKGMNFKDKYYCRKIKNDDLFRELLDFFTISEILIEDLIKTTIFKLKETLNAIQSFDFMKIPYSSLLIVYDAENIDPHSKSQNEFNLSIKLIDFGYFTEPIQMFEDTENCIFNSLNSLINSLESLINK